MLKQFGDFRDFTKAGLGHGERAAVWIYDRFSKWSKRWFTHIFLALVMILYTLVNIMGERSS